MTDLMDLAVGSDLPLCVRYFLLVNRLPGVQANIIKAHHGLPKCFAKYQGEKVRLTMASRFGDVGISRDLNREYGYEVRVGFDELSNFSEE